MTGDLKREGARRARQGSAKEWHVGALPAFITAAKAVPAFLRGAFASPSRAFAFDTPAFTGTLPP
jgi:hypothetical protein